MSLVFLGQGILEGDLNLVSPFFIFFSQGD